MPSLTSKSGNSPLNSSSSYVTKSNGAFEMTAELGRKTTIGSLDLAHRGMSDSCARDIRERRTERDKTISYWFFTIGHSICI